MLSKVIETPVVSDAQLRTALLQWLNAHAQEWKGQADEARRKLDGLDLFGANARDLPIVDEWEQQERMGHARAAVYEWAAQALEAAACERAA